MRAHRILHQVWQCSKGVTAIEYALMAGTISTIIIFTVASVGKQVGNSFQHTAAELAAISGSGGGSGGGTTNNDENAGGGYVGTAGNDSASDTGNNSDTGSNSGNNCSSNGKGKAKGKGQNC